MTRTCRAPVMARLLVTGSGFVSLATSISLPFLAIFLRQDLSLEPAAVGLLIGSSVFFSIFGGFLAGALSDIFGRHQVLLLSMVGVVLSFISLYLSHNVVPVFASSSTMALFASAFNPVGKALLSDLLPAGERVRWFSYQYLGYNLGFAVGPVFGAALGLAGARLSFLVAAAVYTCYLIAMGCAAALSAPIGASHAKPARQRQEAPLRRIRDSVRVVATDRRLRYVLIAAILLETAYGRVSVLLAQYLVINYVAGTEILAAVLTTNAVTVVGFQLIASRAIRKRSPVSSIIVGSLLLFAGMVAFAFADTAVQFVAAMVVLTVGETFIIPAEFAIIDRIALENQRGSYFGAQSFAQLGGFLGPYLGGLLLAGFGGPTAFLGLGSLPLVSVVIYVVVGRRIPELCRPVTRATGRDPAATV